MGRPPISANSAGAPCTPKAWAIAGSLATSTRASCNWPFIELTASPSACAMGNRRSSVGTHMSITIGKVADDCTTDSKLVSETSIT